MKHAAHLAIIAGRIAEAARLATRTAPSYAAAIAGAGLIYDDGAGLRILAAQMPYIHAGDLSIVAQVEGATHPASMAAAWGRMPGTGATLTRRQRAACRLLAYAARRAGLTTALQQSRRDRATGRIL